MTVPPENSPEDLLWWDLVADYPDLGDGLEELSNDPDAGVVAAIGIFTLLKLRFWDRLPTAVSDPVQHAHQSDDSPPPGAAGE